MVTIINSVLKNGEDVGLISVRWRDEDGNRQEDVFRHNPYVYLDPANVNQLQSTKEVVAGTPRASFPLSEKAFARRLKEWRRKKSYDNRAVWEQGVKMDGVVHVEEDPDTVTRDGVTLTRVEFRDARSRSAFRRAYSGLSASRTKHEEQFCIRPPMEKDSFESLFNDAPTHTLYFDLELLQYHGNGDFPKYTDMRNPRHDVRIGLNSAGLQEMSLIAVYADWLDQYLVWAHHPNFAEYDTGALPREYAEMGEVRYFNDEREMLENFVQWIEIMDPDMLVAWNGDGYDLPMLRYRLEVTGVGANRMSPRVSSSNGQFTTTPDYLPPSDNWTDEGERVMKGKYAASRQPIRGRATIDLQPAFVGWWRSTKGQTLGSYVSLDRATNDLLKDYIDVGKATDFKPDFDDKTYDTFIEDYIYYNIVDVAAMVEIERYANVIQLHLAMQNFLKVPFGSTFNSTRFCGVMFSKEAGFLPVDPVWDNQPYQTYWAYPSDDLIQSKPLVIDGKDTGYREYAYTREYGPDERYDTGYLLDPKNKEDGLAYEGAEVVDVLSEGNKGLHFNVAAFDAKSMYPYNIVGKNICWLTAYKPKEGDPNAVWFDIHLRKGKQVIGRESIAFHPADKMEGSLPRIVSVVLERRAHYKKVAKECRLAGDDLGAKQADNMQKAVKVVANSFYGVLGNAWEWGRDSLDFATFGLAGATTKFGKKQVQSCRKYCEDLGYKSIFGHTDSVFVKMGDDRTVEDCIEQCLTLADDISAHIQKDLGHTGAEWEFEQFMDRYFIAKKNRYAGRIAWVDGEMVTDKPLSQRLKASGFELKAANTSKVVRDVQLETLSLMFDGAGFNEVVDFCRDKYDTVASGKVPVAELAPRMTIQQHLPHQYQKTGWNRYSPCNCGGCPIMITKDMTKAQKGGLRKNRKDDLCYTIQGPRGSDHRRYTVGEPLWRLMDERASAAAWFNDFIANENEPPIVKGESFYSIPVRDGPYPVPYRNNKVLGRQYGFIGVRNIEQAEAFTPDFEALANSTVVEPLKNVFEGMQWDIEIIRGFRPPTLQEFLY